MASGLSPEIRVFADTDALSRALAEHLAAQIAARTAGGANFALVLSGGNTPSTLYRCLAEDYRDRIPWALVNIFWSDERYVPHDDPHSNYRMARETLLDHVPVPGANVHPMPTHFADPEDAARAYEDELRQHVGLPVPRFDVILLGMGADGHTASLFPGSAALEERERWVVASRSPVAPYVRLTLTFPVLDHAAEVCFLVAGGDKAEALRRVITQDAGADAPPAARVRPAQGRLIWWMDRAAASRLDVAPGIKLL